MHCTNDKRDGLALVANCITPYRINLHRLIAAGIPELKLHTLITHADADFKWSVAIPESIHTTFIGSPGDSPLAGTFHAPLREWRKGRQLIQYLKNNRVRAVICTGYRYISYMRLISCCHRSGIPLFVRSDSNIRSERPLRPIEQLLKKRVYAWWLPKVSGVMPMGELGEQFFLKYGADQRNMYRVPYTPDYDAFSAVSLDRLRQFRQKYGLSDQRDYLLFSGRLVPAKRVDLLIDAFAQIAGQRPGWDLLIVGEGRLREELRRSVPEHLQNRIRWTSFLEDDELISAYHAADVLLLPSEREPWAVVVQEAMAAGLVVIASDVVGAAHELIEDRSSGRIFPAGDRDALAEAILDVTKPENLETYKDRSRSALKQWRERLDPVAEIRRALTSVGVLSSLE